MVVAAYVFGWSCLLSCLLLPACCLNLDLNLNIERASERAILEALEHLQKTEEIGHAFHYVLRQSCFWDGILLHWSAWLFLSFGRGSGACICICT